MRRTAATLLALAALSISPLHAQYRLHSWENFESGFLDPAMMHLHNSSPETTRVVDLKSIGDPAILEGAAAGECGKFALEVRTDKARRFIGLASPTHLIRSKLGEKGKALFQADFYLKGHVNIGHTVAIAAVASTPEAPLKKGLGVWTLYRFGVLQQQKTYFSFTNATPKPAIYLHQSLAEIVPANEGWHRLQLLFEGDKTVSCYVDGRPTSFSPIVEGTFEKIHPGLIVTAPEDAPLVAYIDNLSIQWTPDADAPMPESPWVPSTAPAPVVAGGPTWSKDYDATLGQARQSGKPVLAMFYNPTSIACQQLMNDVLARDHVAHADLGRFELVKIDINQLKGGSLAEKLGVTRVPTFVALGADGAERARVVVAKDDRWSQIGPQLAKAHGGN